MSKAKIATEHRDILSRVLAVGDAVAMCDNNSMSIAIVEALNPKMIKVRRPSSRYSQHKYSIDVIKIDGPELTLYLLRMN